jgi:Ca2+-binding RTX toxin-like protein
VLRGGPRDDVLWGSGGDDDIDGGAGNDNVNGGEGANRVAGGAGDDYVSAYGPSVVRLLTGGRPAGRARFTVRAGHTRTVSIELRAGARRRLVSARQLALVVRVDTRDAAGRRSCSGRLARRAHGDRSGARHMLRP